MAGRLVLTARAAFKQDDLTRALKGVKAAGFTGATVRLRPGGEMLIYVGDAASAGPDGPNEWDPVLHDEKAAVS